MTTPEAEVNGSANLLSEEEAAKAKAEICGEEEEFQEEIEIDCEGNQVPDSEGNFEVSKEELSILRAELACEFPEDYEYLSDAYILSVASKPYSKNLSVRRPLDYSMEKLKNVMQWREDNSVVDIMDLIHLANGPETAPEAVEQPQLLAQAKAVVTCLNNGSMYWHGFTKGGQPILWIRTNRKPWYPDTEADLKALILMADIGISCMPKNVTDFTVISESTSPPPPHPGFLIQVLKTLVKGYPDRLNVLVSAPISSITQFVMKLLFPLMPGRLSSKVSLNSAENVKSKLDEILLNGKDDIPNFFGGTVDHDKFYPDEYSCPNRGEGSLKFDIFGMISRLEKDRDDYESSLSNKGD